MPCDSQRSANEAACEHAIGDSGRFVAYSRIHFVVGELRGRGPWCIVSRIVEVLESPVGRAFRPIARCPQATRRDDLIERSADRDDYAGRRPRRRENFGARDGDEERRSGRWLAALRGILRIERVGGGKGIGARAGRRSDDVSGHDRHEKNERKAAHAGLSTERGESCFESIRRPRFISNEAGHVYGRASGAEASRATRTKHPRDEPADGCADVARALSRRDDP